MCNAHFISCFANSCNLIKFLKQYLNIFARNFVLCIQIRFVSTEKTTRIASRASIYIIYISYLEPDFGFRSAVILILMGKVVVLSKTNSTLFM